MYTDGSGGDSRQDVPAWCKKAGAAAVAFDCEGTDLCNISFFASSVPGRQTVPRAELVGWIGGNELNPMVPCRSDSLHVVKGVSSLSDIADADSSPLLRHSNYDLWRIAYKALEESHAPPPIKVKAHTTLEQVAEGSVSVQDYIGNGMADALAGAAAFLAAEPSPVQTFARRNAALAFHICVRIAIVEGVAHRLRQLENDWEVLKAGQVVSCKAASQEISTAIEASGHVLRRHTRGRLMCSNCQVVKTALQFGYWIKNQCQAVEHLVPAPSCDKVVNRLLQSRRVHASWTTCGIEWGQHRIVQTGMCQNGQVVSAFCLRCGVKASLDHLPEHCWSTEETVSAERPEEVASLVFFEVFGVAEGRARTTERN